MLFEKYRVEEIEKFLPNTDIQGLLNILSRFPAIPHLLFIGPPGTGKTSMAYAVAKKLNLPIIEINASNERGIDMVRDKIKMLSETQMMRVIDLEEADYLTNDAQAALRRIMEPPGGRPNAIFILTANSPHNIIDALHSRCAIFHFTPLTTNQIKTRVLDILKAEGVKPQYANEEEGKMIRDGIEYLAEASHGDLRWACNTLEKIVNANKQITIKEVATLQKSTTIVSAIREALGGNFERAKNTLEDSYLTNGMDFRMLIRDIYDYLNVAPPKDMTEEVKIRLYIKLAETEFRIRSSSADPLILLVGFIAFVWICPHLDPAFPIGV